MFSGARRSLASVANDADAARLWEIAKDARCTVVDVERAIAELVKKSPAGVKWSRERAWGRLVAFVEASAAPRGDTATPRRESCADELRRDALERKREQEALRGAVPITASAVAMLRERGILPAHPS